MIQPFKQNTIYALVGASGTGKSYNAKFVAAQYGLRAIIDDGLLIQADKILAGHSAKNEKSFLAAVRVALFDDKEHRDDIARAIKRYRIRKILILGTSEKMVMRIAARLQLPPPTRIIHIEEMVSKEKIELALKSRQIEGKHVIPVSSNEVRKRYPKIFANGIRFTFHRLTPTQLLAKNNKVVEKSIVQPSFSIQSRRTISEAAIVRMAMLCVGSYDKTICVKKILIIADARGYKLTITMNILPDTQLPLTKRVDNLQKQIINNIESTSGIFIENVNIVIDKVIESR
ncbi:MAG: hypothetical protein J6I73_09385 [Treponema sp.]|nr:hypothetical protein [Treponema sp.]